MTADAYPSVSLPIGAVPAADVARGWAEYDNEFRIVYGEKHTVAVSAVPNGEVWVEPCAVQMADGSIQPRDLAALESGPTVSVQCHWENYLTADEARQLAHAIEKSADVAEQWTDSERHVCGFDWCTLRWREQSHWCLDYVTASMRRGDPYHLTRDHDQHKVGVGVSYDEGNLPCVAVHIDGGPTDDDVDAHLTLTEAVALRDLLDRSIRAAAEATTHMAAHITALAVAE